MRTSSMLPLKNSFRLFDVPIVMFDVVETDNPVGVSLANKTPSA